MENKNEAIEIEGVDAENEGVDPENEGVDNEVLTPEQKLYYLRYPPNVNCNNGRSNQHFMGSIKLIVGSYALHSDAKAYVNVVNDIFTFVEPTSPTNIITNETILNQNIIK